MNAAIKSMKTDFMAVRKYMRTGLVLIFLLVYVFELFFREAQLSLFMLFMLVVIFNTYPFAMDDKYGFFYLSLPQRRDDIVRGRYLMLLSMNLIFFILSLIPVLIIYLSGGNAADVLLNAAALMSADIILFSIQAPVFFKVGYMKGKQFALVPILILAAIFPLSVIAKNQPGLRKIIDSIISFSVNGNPAIQAITVCIFLILVLTSSYYLSLRFFKKREL